MKNKLVYIIILNWNGWRDTLECVESCLKLTYNNYCILLVDNGSSDNSETILRERFPDIPIIQTGSNLGFAGGNNIGIRHALEHGSDYIWLLNNDAIVASDALSELVTVADSEENAGIVGSKIYYHQEPMKLWFAGGVWRTNKSYATHRGQNEEDIGQYDVICEVDYISGCSLLIKSKVVEKVGLMKDDYFLYWEEVDWNASVAEHGWKNYYVPNSIVWHKVSASIGKRSYLANRYYIRNCLLFFQRHEPQRLFSLFCYIYYDAYKQYRNGQIELAKAYLHGSMDFILRKFGKLDSNCF